MASGQLPSINKYSATVPAVATAGNADTNPVIRAPFVGTVTAVTYVPKAAITGAATNNRRLTLLNKKQDGSGTTVVAQLGFASGVNAAAYDEKVITLTATVADRDVAEGDILAWESLNIGTGITDPGGLAIVELSRT